MEMTTNHLDVRVNKPLMNKAITLLQNKVIPAEHYIWYNTWLKSGEWRKKMYFSN